jgi:phosphoglycolate phosphatase
MKPILLFDIDGTILHVKRSFLFEIMDQILIELNISKDVIKQVSFAGRTDRDIFLQLITINGIANDSSFEKVKQLYVDAMLNYLSREHVEEIPGAAEAVHFACSSGLDIGLCTGNFEEVAFKKVEAAGLSDLFEFGGYGCNHKDRIYLPEDAHKSYTALKKTKPHPSQYVIIGDTPNDIRCAKHFGARSIAVTTGSFNENQLRPHKPDYIFDGLSNPEKWINLLKKRF